MSLTYSALLRRIDAEPWSIPPAQIEGSAPRDEPCISCRNIYPDFGDPAVHRVVSDYEREDTFPSFPSLEASAVQGCRLCAVLRWMIGVNWAVRPLEEESVGPIREQDEYWKDLLASDWDGRVKIHTVSFILEQGMPTSPSSYTSIPDSSRSVAVLGFEFSPARFCKPENRIKVGRNEHGHMGQTASFKLYAAGDAPEQGCRSIGLWRPSSEALSSSNLSLISNWLTACANKHPLCKQGNNLPLLPTRVIDVGKLDGSVEPSLKISNGLRAPYVTLSHCWGSPQSGKVTLKLTSFNMSTMLSAIPLESMPANFRDTVISARAMGFKYVWIDSICIIQDSREDWDIEAAKMDQVYQNATVTIAATSAVSVHDGFLARKDERPQFRVGFGPTSRSPRIDMIFRANDDESNGSWVTDIDSRVWNQRAWILQERILSRRILHFAQAKIYFECLEGTKSEEGEVSRGTKRLHPLTSSIVSTQSNPRDPLPRAGYYDLWIEIAKQFSRRYITFKNDKLPATSGLANMMAIYLKGDTYYAGIWEGDFIRSIMWLVDTVTSRYPSDEYLAPSWSWVSSDNPITWTYPSDPKHFIPKSKCELLEINTTLAGKNSFGQVKSGFIKVSGRLKQITFVEECDEDARWFWSTRARFPYDLYCGNDKFAEGMIDLDDVKRLGKSLWYLEVDSNQRPSGLLLKAIEEGTELYYRRVGVAITWDLDTDVFSPDFLNSVDPSIVHIV